MAAPSFPEMTNWHKCSRLLIEGGLSILKEFLKSSYSPGSLDQFLASKKKELTDLRNKHILNASQWVKLFPHSKIESLDITLICFISNLTIQSHSQKTALDGIRDLRNNLFAHVPKLSMDTVEFVKNWKLIHSALKKAQSELGTNIPLRDLIDTVETEEVVNGDELREALETWKEIQQTQKKHSSEVSELKGEVHKHCSGISELKCDVKEHTSGISELKGEVKEHSSGISELKGEVKKHSSEISELKCEVKEHSSKILNIEGVVNEMKATRRQKRSIRSKDLSELQICLVKYYTEYYMKSPVTATASSGCETVIDDIYAEPELMLVNHRAFRKPISDNKVSISLMDILLKDKNKCYNIYFIGEAGMGKTSLCQYILSRWCKACQADEPNDDLEMALKQYAILFYISLRNASDQHNIQDMIVSQLLKYIASNNKTLSCFKPESLLQKLFEQSSRKCLIILDGLDEWTAQGRSKTPVISDGVPERDFNLKYTIMTTTRPWKLEELRLKDSEMDLQIQINGVKSISTFAEKLISYFNNQFSMNKTYNDFGKCLSKAGLIEMQTIPILFKYLICLWFESQDFGKSKTELYTNLVELCLEKAEKREGVKQLRQPGHISTDTTITTPEVFKGKEKCNQYKDILKAVGELALKTAMDQNGMQLMFNSTVGLSDDQLKLCLNVGILTQGILPDMICKKKSISFLQKTFHEYFAALYMGWLSSIPVEISSLTNTNIYKRQDVFIFLSGIWPSVSERLLEIFLAGTYDKDIMLDPMDIAETNLQTVVMRCCIESLNQNGHCPRVELRVINFNIGYCKSLLSSRLNIEGLNPATLDKSSYCRAFFTIISQMSQKEILHTKGENCVLDFSELCGLKHLFLRHLKLDSLLVSPTLCTLELDDIEIYTCHGMTALLSSIVQAESLNYLFCRNVRCENREFTVKQQESITSIKITEQLRKNYCTIHSSKEYFIHMDLSNLTRLRTIKLENMSINELHVMSPVIKNLALKDMNIEKHDGIVSLMKSISSLETLDEIFMENIICTEHESNECFFHIDLSKHTSLERISLKNMSISELHVSPVIKSFILKNIKIAKHDEIVSLMRSVSSLETLTEIVMSNIHCTEHASNEKCFLNIDLSKSTRLCWIILDNMSICVLHVSPVTEGLTLKHIKIAKHDGIISLMKSVSCLETLDDIDMNNIHCTEHASNEKCFLNIDLSNLTRMSESSLINMSISELHVRPTILLTLINIKIAQHDGIISLIKNVSSLKSLNEIEMNNVHCTEHASNEKCFLNIDLSKLTKLSCIRLDNMSIIELHVSPVTVSLTLIDIKIAKHDGIVSLLKSVSSLETLTAIVMSNIHCTEHARNEECFLNIDLSKLTRTFSVELTNISISELRVNPYIKDLVLEGIKIAKHNEIISLMKSISRLPPASRIIYWETIHCTEHACDKCFPL